MTDFNYVFWFSGLHYIFPKKYIDPITDAFYGLFYKTKAAFKFGKKETDLRNEDLMNKNQQENNPINPPKNANQSMERKDNKDNGFNNPGLDLENNNANVSNPYPRIDEENLDQ